MVKTDDIGDALDSGQQSKKTKIVFFVASRVLHFFVKLTV